MARGALPWWEGLPLLDRIASGQHVVMRATRLRRSAAIIGAVLAAAAAAVAGLALPAMAAPAQAHPAQAVAAGPTQLWSVSCPVRSGCVAVGGTFEVFEGRAIVRSWNGKHWAALRVGRSFRLIGISCRSSRQCTAVGETTSQRALVLRWNGRKWLIQHTPSTGGGKFSYSALSGISCPSATACFAVGVADRTNLAERWNGNSWSIQSLPSPSSSIDEGMSSVSCPSTATCMAVGGIIDGQDDHQPIAEQWNGKAWTFLPTPEVPDTSGLGSVSCPRARACVAVGNAPIDEGPPLPLAESWDGTSWKVLPAPPHPDAYAQLNSVTCTSARFCIAVGSACSDSHACVPSGKSGFRALALRWNGRKWTTLRTPRPAGKDLESVSCSSWRACTAVGRTASALLAERWNGRTWTAQSVPR